MAYARNKTEHAFQIFHKDLKDGGFPPVIFMYGEEEYLIQWACDSLAEKFTEQSVRELDYVKIDEEDWEVDKLLEACDTFSVFSERRIIWANNFPPLFKKTCKGFGDKEREELIRYIQNPNEKAVLIFSCAKPDESISLTKLLKKQCLCYDFSSLDSPQLMAFAEKRLRNAGAEISRACLKYFIDETGYFNRESEYRIYNLENDIKKLVSYAGGEPITEEHVDRTLRGDTDTFAFNFLDAVGAGRKDTAFRLLHNMLTGGSEVFSVIGLLVNQFELICEIKELREQGMQTEQIAKKLKASVFRVKKAASVADKLSYKKIKGILSQLYETDRNIKTGNMEQNLALELLIGKV